MIMKSPTGARVLFMIMASSRQIAPVSGHDHEAGRRERARADGASTERRERARRGGSDQGKAERAPGAGAIRGRWRVLGGRWGYRRRTRGGGPRFWRVGRPAGWRFR